MKIMLTSPSFPGAPHLSMISNPGTVTRVILAAVHATS